MSSDYMDYTDDACMGIFTLGQGTRARVNFEPGRYREQLGSRKAYISGAYWLFDCPSDYQTFTLNTEGFTIPSNAYIFWSVSSNIDIISGQGTPSITVRGKTISNGSVQNGSIYVNVANVGICNQTVNVPTTIENTITIYKWTDYNFDCSPSTSTCPNTGNISYQRWENIGGGNSIQDLRNNTNNLNNSPSNSQNLTLFEAPANILDNYGVRMRGYVCPPTSGNYIFWVAGDDNAELWLSPNDQPNNLSRIAYHNSWTPPREWNIFSTQQSAPIMLQAGQRYYVEALMKEGGGGDNLAVGWQLPNGSLERPIPGNRLIPFSSGGCTPPNAPSLSANPASINGGQSSTLSVSGCGGTVSWNTNQTGNSITVSPAQTTTYTATCSANGCTSGSGSVTVTVNGGGGGGCATGNFNGHFDYANCGNFGGWALDQNNFGRTVNVEIRVDGQLVATIPANQSRPDLVAGFGTPQAEFHGWTYNVPANAPWRNGTNRTASARICGATNDLNESPKTVNCTGGSGGCTPPAAPNLSANPASINGGQSSTLSASGCGGAVSWNTNQTGNSITVSPAQTTTYTATCSANGCTSGSGSVTVTVNGGVGGNCATGNFNGHFDYANFNSFSGWALDQNNFGRTVNVEIRVDGQLVATVAANGSRPDLVGAFGNNPQAEFHGWSYSIPANAPWRNGTNRTASARICGATNDLNESPKTVNCTGGSGGCTPPAAPNLSANPASINGGQSSTLSASGCGGTVSWNTNQTGNSITVSPAQTTTYTATCSVNGCTSGSGSVTVTVNGGGGGCATGNFNGHLDYANCGNFGGWALDQNNFGRTIEVEILINGQLVATIPANQSRSDLVAAFGTPQAEFHGWTYNVPANAPWRNGTVAVVARPCGGSNNLINSPANVNFSNCRVGAIEDLTERRLEPPLLDLVLSPNPTDGQVRVETWLAEAGAVQIAVQDLTGRTAKGFDFKAKSGNFSQLLNLTDLPVGVYLLQLQTTQKRFVKKMILVR